MQLDKKTLDRLLDLSDGQLRVLLKRLLAEYGVDLWLAPGANLLRTPRQSAFSECWSEDPLEQMDIGKLREALRGTTDTDIARFLQLMQASGLGKGGGKA